MCDRNVKSEHILTKLCALNSEYICERTTEFCWKIIFDCGVINLQISMTKYVGFQYSVTCGTAVTRTEVTLCWRNQCETVQLLTLTLDFIAPALWPAKSHDFNPVDYKIWGKLQEHVYRSRIRDVNPLFIKSHWLDQEWEHFQHVFINEAVRQWRLRLRACIRALVGHFEHRRMFDIKHKSMVGPTLWQSHVCLVAYSGHLHVCFWVA